MEKQYDLIIIGSGPAGLAAAIYAQRAKLDTIIIEENFVSGGQVVTTYEVDNYPGLPGISGMDLGTTLRDHAEKMGAEFVRDKVLELKLDGEDKVVVAKKGEYHTKTVIVATGAKHRMLDVPGEKELAGMGVSYCATCDGAFFRGKTVAVVGGGDVAVEDAIFLARACEKVYVIHRRDELRAAKILQERLLALENVEMVWDTVVDEIKGENQVEAVSVTNRKTGEKKDLAVNGIFIAVGITPNSELVSGKLEMDAQGYIKAQEDGVTSVEGVYAAGDVRQNSSPDSYGSIRRRELRDVRSEPSALFLTGVLLNHVFTAAQHVRRPGNPLCILQECLVAFFCLVDIRLGCNLPRRMHIQDRHAGIDHLHAVQRQDISDGSAAADIYFTQLCGLPSNSRIVQDPAQIAQVFCIGIVGAGFSAGSCKLVEYHTFAEECRVFLLKCGSVQRIVTGAYVGRKHSGIAQAAAQLQLGILPGQVHQLCQHVLKELGLHSGSADASDLFLVHQQADAGMCRSLGQVEQRGCRRVEQTRSSWPYAPTNERSKPMSQALNAERSTARQTGNPLGHAVLAVKCSIMAV